MYQGNWKCSSCGGAITELPFQPRSETGLTCRNCFMKSKGGSGGGNTTPQPEPDEFKGGAEAPDIPFDADLATEPPPGEIKGSVSAPPGEKPRFEGNWKCATCGADITSLPFSPRDTSNLKCIDCFKRSKQE